MTDFDLHLISMKSPEYAIHHNKMFHGAGHININAMQMCYNEQKDDAQFFPTTLYDVYLDYELDFNEPLYKLKTSHEICDKLGFSRGIWLKITQNDLKLDFGINAGYIFKESGRTAIEYNIKGKLFYESSALCKYLSIDKSLLTHRYQRGDYTKKYVVLDVNGNVISEIT